MRMTRRAWYVVAGLAVGVVVAIAIVSAAR